MGDGEHTFDVRAIDNAANTGDAASHTWYIDLADPVATVTGQSGADDPDNSQSATFTYTVEDAAGFGVTSQCALDGNTANDYGDCTDSSTHAVSSLTEGSHTFYVQATDWAGNTHEDSYTWYVDLTDPVPSVTSGPDQPSTNAQTATFVSSVTDTYDNSPSRSCKLDGSSINCDDQITGLAEGTHTFRVTGIDDAGNSAYTEYSWDVDLTDPVLSISTTTDDPTNSATAALSISASDAAGHGYTVTCTVNGAATDCAAGDNTFDLGADATTTVVVTLTDTAGNAVSASEDWYRDATAPTVSILSLIHI